MQHSLRVAYVVFSFCAAFFLGGIKGTPPLLVLNWPCHALILEPCRALGWEVLLRLRVCLLTFLGSSNGCAAMVVGPVAAALMILGNVSVILVLFPAHVWWTIYSLIK